MKTNNYKQVLLINHQAFIDEVQQMLRDQKKEILHELRKRKNDDLFTRQELAKYLKVSQQTIINWASRGILNPTYIGSRVYYKADEVNKLLNQ